MQNNNSDQQSINIKNKQSVPSHIQKQNQTPQRSELRKVQLFRKMKDKFNAQLNPRNNEITSMFIDKTLNDYIFGENKVLSSKEIFALEAKILQFQKNNNIDSMAMVTSNNKEQANKKQILNQSANSYPILSANVQKQIQEMKDSKQNVQEVKNQQNQNKKDQDILSVKSQKSNKSQTSLQKLNIQNNLAENQQQKSSRYSNRSIGSVSTQNLNKKSINIPPLNRNLSQEIILNGKYNSQNIDFDAISSVSSFGPPKSVIMLDAKKNRDEYAAILEYKTKLYHEEIEEKKQKKKLQTIKVQEELDKQIKLQEEKKKQEKQKETNYYQQELQLQQEFDQNLQKKQEKDRQHRENIKKTLQEQMELKNILDKKQKKAEEKYEKQLVDLYKNNLQEENDKINNKKQKDHALMKKVWQESLKQQEDQENNQKSQQENEKAQTGKYGQILEELNAKREQQSKIRKEHQKYILNRWDDAVEKQRLLNEEKQLKYEQNLERQKKEEDLKFLQQEQKKKERVEQLRKQMLKENQNQKQIKSQSINPLKQDSVEQGQIWKQEDTQFWEREKQKLEKLKQNQKSYQMALEQQIKSGEEKQKQLIMSKNELLQNKNILKKIAQDQLLSSQPNTNRNQDDNISVYSKKSNNSYTRYSSSKNTNNFLQNNSNFVLKSVRLEECNRV